MDASRGRRARLRRKLSLESDRNLAVDFPNDRMWKGFVLPILATIRNSWKLPTTSIRTISMPSKMEKLTVPPASRASSFSTGCARLRNSCGLGARQPS